MSAMAIFHPRVTLVSAVVICEQGIRNRKTYDHDIEWTSRDTVCWSRGNFGAPSSCCDLLWPRLRRRTPQECLSDPLTCICEAPSSGQYPVNEGNGDFSPTTGWFSGLPTTRSLSASAISLRAADSSVAHLLDCADGRLHLFQPKSPHSSLCVPSTRKRSCTNERL
jgi:hypothetical protein